MGQLTASLKERGKSWSRDTKEKLAAVPWDLHTVDGRQGPISTVAARWQTKGFGTAPKLRSNAVEPMRRVEMPEPGVVY
jgi:hypothetical protein